MWISNVDKNNPQFVEKRIKDKNYQHYTHSYTQAAKKEKAFQTEIIKYFHF